MVETLSNNKREGSLNFIIRLKIHISNICKKNCPCMYLSIYLFILNLIIPFQGVFGIWGSYFAGGETYSTYGVIVPDVPH